MLLQIERYNETGINSLQCRKFLRLLHQSLVLNLKLKFVYHTRKLEAILWNIKFLLGPFFCVAMLGGTYNVNDFDIRFRTNVYKDIVFNQSNMH